MATIYQAYKRAERCQVTDIQTEKDFYGYDFLSGGGTVVKCTPDCLPSCEVDGACHDLNFAGVAEWFSAATDQRPDCHPPVGYVFTRLRLTWADVPNCITLRAGEGATLVYDIFRDRCPLECDNPEEFTSYLLASDVGADAKGTTDDDCVQDATLASAFVLEREEIFNLNCADDKDASAIRNMGHGVDATAADNDRNPPVVVWLRVSDSDGNFLAACAICIPPKPFCARKITAHITWDRGTEEEPAPGLSLYLRETDGETCWSGNPAVTTDWGTMAWSEGIDDGGNAFQTIVVRDLFSAPYDFVDLECWYNQPDSGGPTTPLVNEISFRSTAVEDWSPHPLAIPASAFPENLNCLTDIDGATETLTEASVVDSLTVVIDELDYAGDDNGDQSDYVPAIAIRNRCGGCKFPDVVATPD